MKQIISDRSDIAFYLLLYPIAHQEKKSIVSKIMCGKDDAERLQLLETAMDTGEVKIEDCGDKTVTKNMAFGLKNNIFSTPSLFFADGTMFRGALDAATIINKVDGLNKKDEKE